MKKIKTRILKNGKNQYIALVRSGGIWPFCQWYHLSYFPRSNEIYTISGTPRNELSSFDNEPIVKELFDSEKEAQQVIDDYLSRTVFMEVK